MPSLDRVSLVGRLAGAIGFALHAHVSTVDRREPERALPARPFMATRPQLEPAVLRPEEVAVVVGHGGRHQHALRVPVMREDRAAEDLAELLHLREGSYLLNGRNV